MHSSLNQWYRLMLLCVLVHFMCTAVFTDRSLNPQCRLMLLVHLCTLCAPSESSLNQLKCCWLCKCVRSVHHNYFLSVQQKAAFSILCKSLSGIPLEPCTFFQEQEYNGMSFNLISQKSVPNIPPLFKYRKH